MFVKSAHLNVRLPVDELGWCSSATCDFIFMREHLKLWRLVGQRGQEHAIRTQLTAADNQPLASSGRRSGCSSSKILHELASSIGSPKVNLAFITSKQVLDWGGLEFGTIAQPPSAVPLETKKILVLPPLCVTVS
jgi:hypothetical protein